MQNIRGAFVLNLGFFLTILVFGCSKNKKNFIIALLSPIDIKYSADLQVEQPLRIAVARMIMYEEGSAYSKKFLDGVGDKSDIR